MKLCKPRISNPAFVPIADVLMRSQASTTALSAVSTPIVSSVPGMLFESVAGITMIGIGQFSAANSRAAVHAS